MNGNRKTAIIVGALFIIATVVYVVGNSLSKPVLDTPDYLINVAAHETQVTMGALFELIAALACAGIAVGLYPILRKHREALALGSVGFRIIEALLYIVAVVGLLSLLSLSQEYAKAGAANTASFQASGTLLLAVRKWAAESGVIAFTFGALMYYYVLYQARLIPRWLSVWGILGAVSTLATALLTVLGQLVPSSTVFILLNVPIGLQEMVLAVWLIVRGFGSSASAAESVHVDTNDYRLAPSK